MYNGSSMEVCSGNAMVISRGGRQLSLPDLYLRVLPQYGHGIFFICCMSLASSYSISRFNPHLHSPDTFNIFSLPDIIIIEGDSNILQNRSTVHGQRSSLLFPINIHFLLMSYGSDRLFICMNPPVIASL